jgi:hypothetical protein
MPLAPMGCAVQLHESCERQRTWAENTTDGWYLQTSLEHYRCHKIHVKKTNSERVSDSVFFKHKNITQPTLSMVDLLKKDINNLVHALKGRRNTNGIKEMEALQKLDKLLNKTLEATTPRVTNPVDKLTPRVASQCNAPTPRVASQSGVPTPKVEATAPSTKTKEIPPERSKNAPTHMRCNQQQSQNTPATPPNELTPIPMHRTGPVNPQQGNRRVPKLPQTTLRPKTQRNMGEISCKRIWTTSTRPQRWKSKGNKHNLFHQQG